MHVPVEKHHGEENLNLSMEAKNSDKVLIR